MHYEVDSSLRLDELERIHVHFVLSECDGNQSEAARRLGIHRTTLVRILRRPTSRPSLPTPVFSVTLPP